MTHDDEDLGRACYEAFCEETKAWQPYPADWEKQAAVVKQGWIAAAKAVLSKMAIRAGAIEPKGSS